MIVRICPCGNTFETKHSRKIHCTRFCPNDANVNSSTWNSRQRNYKYKATYGITIEVYNEIFEKQQGCCKICKTHQSNLKKTLHVDHNHETEEVRGLLCSSCNLAIGLLKESPEIITSALEYIKLPVKL